MKALFNDDDEPTVTVPSSRLPSHLCSGRPLKRRSPSGGNDALKKRPCDRSEGLVTPAEYVSPSGDAPHIEIAVQPEKYFRARYVSEGSRGPMRGRGDGPFPTVKICGYSGPALVDVYLSNTDGEVHDNVLVLGTNNNGSGEVVTVDGGLQCIRVHTSAASSMEAVFSNISIRRLRKFEIDAALKARGVDPEAHDCDRSSACLKFVAHIPGQKALSVQSETLYCSTEPGEPEIYLMSPNSGKAGDSIVLVGKRFKAGFKIRFFADTEQGPWEAWASVNRDISNQGAAVVTVPHFGSGEVTSETKVEVEVRIGPERDPLNSAPAEFTYTIPKVECTCCQGQPISLPLTPASVKSRTQSCSPGPISKPPAADQLSNLFESLPANILSSVENLETHPADNTIDLFPSNASSISQASSISDYQDFPELLNTPDFVSSLAFGNEHIPVDPVAFDWDIINQVVCEYSSTLPAGSTSTLAQYLYNEVGRRSPFLYELYQKCCMKSAETVDSTAASLMKLHFQTYIPQLLPAV